MHDKSFEATRELISRVFDIEGQHVKPQTNLNEDFGADSLDKIEVAIQLEEEFGVKIKDADALDIDTVDDAARLVRKSTHV